MTSWSLESSIDTANSMNARGYGLKKRTNYSNYSFCFRDGILGMILVMLAGMIIYGNAKGTIKFACYPTFFFAEESALGNITLIAYGLFSFTPMIINIKEEIKWKYLRSKI